MITPELTRARWAVAAIFAVHGMSSGSFAARIPWVADHLRLEAGQLGLVLLMPAIGALVSMPFAGRLVNRFGGKTVTRVFIAAWTVAVMLVPLAPNRWLLMAILLLAGAAAGTSDMAMNAEGVAVEKGLGRSIMSSLHGMWSVGGLIGGGIGAAAAYLGVGAPANLAAVGFLLLIAGFFAGRYLLVTEPGSEQDSAPRFSLPRGPVLIIGLVGLCAVFAEIAAADWSAVYMRRVLGTGEGTAAVAYATFALAMSASRLSGDYVVARIGAVRTVRFAGLAGVIGGILVATSWSGLLVTLGFGLIGVGVAVVVPLAFSAAGHADAHPANAIAGVATVSYGAGLAAPGVIGGVAHLTSLPVSFALVTGLILIVVLSASRLRGAEVAHAPVPTPSPMGTM
ncbi:MFS transporter [Rhizocola hellebori]|uniref:MFS transporter n=1 Tax=Rhizocola hellebori TaxID=1392758 RepID=A0A8J3QFK7_9ACTN|nr:MFS transporter [Rhizocola hellebori]GIH10038.1 MFS transporter [Rhizocola hellebori]